MVPIIVTGDTIVHKYVSITFTQDASREGVVCLVPI